MGSKVLFSEEKLSPLTSYLTTEIEHYNSLLNTISSSLAQLREYLEGNCPLTETLETTWKSVKDMRVPQLWQDSKRPLMEWLSDLKSKVEFVRSWMAQGEPKSFWAPALAHFNSFLSALLQEHVRSNKSISSKLEFEFTIPTGPPPQGATLFTDMAVQNAAWANAKLTFIEGNVQGVPRICVRVVAEEEGGGWRCAVRAKSGGEKVGEAVLEVSGSLWQMQRVALVADAKE